MSLSESSARNKGNMDIKKLMTRILNESVNALSERAVRNQNTRIGKNRGVYARLKVTTLSLTALFEKSRANIGIITETYSNRFLLTGIK